MRTVIVGLRHREETGAKMIEHDQEAQAERAADAERCDSVAPDGILSCTLTAGHEGRHEDADGSTWVYGTHGHEDELSESARLPVYSEAELIGMAAEAIEKLPEAGRVPALRYLMERYGMVVMIRNERS